MKFIIFFIIIACIFFITVVNSGQFKILCKNEGAAYKNFMMICQMASNKEYCHCLFFSFDVMPHANAKCEFNLYTVGDWTENIKAKRACGHLQY